MFRTALIILSGNATASLLTLARNLLIARLIPVEDYGIAATFAISVAIVEMLSALGLQLQIVQAKDGEDDRLQAGLQGFQMLRGIFSATVLFFAAVPIARFLGIEHVAWAFKVLSVVPLLTALVHFDVHRLHRQMRYLPGILTTTVPAVVSFLAAYPLFLLFGDYRVMLFAILAQTALASITSHIVSERRFKMALDRKIMARGMQFGWPLLLNGALLFAVFNGEKLIIGRELGMADLAIFAMGMTLTLTPTLVLAKSSQTFFLPQLSSAQDDPDLFSTLSMATVQAGFLNGCLLIVGVAIVGVPLIELVLGDKFASLIPLLGWLAILNAVRVFKSGSAVVALSRGKTSNAMVSNIIRTATLPISWWVVVGGGDIQTVILIALGGESLGFFASLLMLKWRVGFSLRPMFGSLAALFVFMLGAVLLARWDEIAMLADVRRGWGTAGLVALLFCCILSMSDLRRYVGDRQVFKFTR